MRIRNADSQPDSSNLCGHDATTFSLAICRGIDPTLLRFDADNLVKMVGYGLRNKHFSEDLPGKLSNETSDLRVITKLLKLHCVCQRPYVTGRMVTCCECGNHYHANCVAVTYDVCPPLIWKGPCCPGPPPERDNFMFECVDDTVDERCPFERSLITSSPVNAGTKGRRVKSPTEIYNLSGINNF